MPRAALLQFLWYGGQLVWKRDPQYPLFEWTAERSHDAEEHMTQSSLRQAEVQTVHTVLLAMWKILKGWPHTWYTLLEQLVQREEPLSTTPTTCIPALLKAQFPNEAFTWLHEGTEDFMWQTPGLFVQLSVWQRYWESIERERQTRRSKKSIQRTLNLLELSLPRESM